MLKALSRRNPTVLVFDSGVGGLSVCQSILNHCPNVRILYVADNAAFPYGTKEEQYLRGRIMNVLLAQCAKHRPDMLVIACNTASTIVLPDLRAHLNIPVVGVVPAIKPAAQRSQTGVIGLLATPATVKRTYTNQLVADYALGCEVVSVGSSRLVEVAESFLRGEEVDRQELTEIVAAFFKGEQGAQIDIIILGCTHFPLLRSLLEKSAPRLVEWIDSGDAVAKQVKRLFGVNGCSETCIESETRVESDTRIRSDMEQEVSLSGKDEASRSPYHQIMFTGDRVLTDAFKASLVSLGFEDFDIVGNIH